MAKELTTQVLIGFSRRHTNVLSRLIRFVTKARWSHSLIIYRSKEMGQIVRVEADWNGFHMRPVGDKLALRLIPKDAPDSVEAVAVALPLEYCTAVLEAVGERLSQPYDYPGAIGIAWVALGRLFGKRWGNPLQHKRALFCSEIVAAALKQAGHPAFKDVDPGTMSPGDLYDILAQPKVLQIVQALPLPVPAPKVE